MIQKKMKNLLTVGREKVLLVKVKCKNKSAFIEAYDAHVDQIYRFIYFKVSNKDDANDLTSQVFLKAWNYIQDSGIKEVNSLKALFYKIARNTVIDFYRSNKNVLNVPIDGLEGLLKYENDIESEIDNKRELDVIAAKMFKLKSEYREVLIFYYVDELSTTEIAKILGKTNGNVRVLLHRALKALKTIL